MGRIKNFYHDELERRNAIENDRCGECGDDLPCYNHSAPEPAPSAPILFLAVLALAFIYAMSWLLV